MAEPQESQHTGESGGKYRLAEAVKQLMGRQSLEDITVKEITGEAGVSRQTFYRHFLDKYDLVNWYFDELLANSFRGWAMDGPFMKGWSGNSATSRRKRCSSGRRSSRTSRTT